MILALDLGTGSLKAGILSTDGQMLSRCTIPYQHKYWQGGFDPLIWEKTMIDALAHLPSVHLEAIACSSNGPTLVPSDVNGNPTDCAVLWNEEKQISVAGQKSFYLPQIAWFKTHKPDEWSRTRWVFSPAEFLAFRLTGSPAMTTPHDGFLPYIWDHDQLKAYGIDEKYCPPIIRMGQITGKVTRKMSSVTGLSEGLPVLSAGSDFMVSLLGSGTLEEGLVCDRAGTSEGINYCRKTPSGVDGVIDLPHIISGLWNAGVLLPASGSIFNWFRHITGQSDKPYADTLAELDAQPPCSNAPLFFPCLNNQKWPRIFSEGSFHRLQQSHGPAQMGRAVVEALAYQVRHSIELLEGGGMHFDEMRITGGQARGGVWNQLKADITGKKLLIPVIEDAELAGCAATALVALGKKDSLAGAAALYIRIRDVVEPRPAFQKIYNDAYQQYCHLAKKLLTVPA